MNQANKRFKFSSRFSKTGIEFIKIELDVAFTHCRLAEQNPRHRITALRNARKAYECAMRFITRLEIAHKDFTQITAVAERVKFMIEALEKALRDHSGRKHLPLTANRMTARAKR